MMILDVGGEGRNPAAWNLNPRAIKTFGPERGQPIPRHIAGRGEDIPLPDGSVDVLIVERTPLLGATIAELARVASPTATVILRHAVMPGRDPHRLALQTLIGTTRRRESRIGQTDVQETVVVLSGPTAAAAEPADE